MGKHRGYEGGRPPFAEKAMTEQLTFRVPLELLELIDRRCNARIVVLERAAMIRHLLELGIKADIQHFKETE